MKKNGTMVTVLQNCKKCGPQSHIWRSQPLVLRRYPAGNILLSFGVLLARASVSKILLVLRHMGLCVYTARTYFLHQSKFLFPSIWSYWESYQDRLIQELKGKELVWSGDGRFDLTEFTPCYVARFPKLCILIFVRYVVCSLMFLLSSKPK